MLISYLWIIYITLFNSGLYFIPTILSVNGIKWLAINNLRSNWIDPNECPSTKEEKQVFGFVHYQSELCRRMTDLMPYIKTSALETVKMCQNEFNEYRWNCSTILKAPNFDTDLTKGTKEQAYVYALSSAAIVHTIAKACSKGILDYCKCGGNNHESDDSAATVFLSNENTNELPTISTSTSTAAMDMDENINNYRWQGCSDNIEYGISASREWADAKPKLRLSRDLDLGPGGEFIFDSDELELFVNEQQSQNSITTITPTRLLNNNNHEIKGIGNSNNNNFDGKKLIMNQQNNNVGRQLVIKSQYRKCKCHGISSSCHVQTCWNTLPPLKNIAEGLKVKYLQAQQLSSKPHFLNPNTPPTMDLVYLKQSSNYCEHTHRRECNSTDSMALNSCQNLCCERGHYAITVPITEHCHCKYVHCCYVKCKSCLYYVNKSYCN